VRGQAQRDAGAAPRLEAMSTAPRSLVHGRLDHVHADAAARKLGDGGGGGEAGLEDEREELGRRGVGVGRQQAALDGLRADARGVEAAAVVGESDEHLGTDCGPTGARGRAGGLPRALAARVARCQWSTALRMRWRRGRRAARPRSLSSSVSSPSDHELDGLAEAGGEVVERGA
jgi:hypothetical protein